MSNSQYFLICGLSRLTVRVARTMAEEGASVTVIRLAAEGLELIETLPPGVRVVNASGENYDYALTEANLPAAACLLALGDDDLSNLRASVAAQAVACDVPVVVRTFDPVFADQLETGLNIRRAYSVSALAAPAFIAAACGSAVLETLRLGASEVPICRITIRPDSPFVSLTAARLQDTYGCALIARTAAGSDWRVCSDNEPALDFIPGEQILVGGLLTSVLRLCVLNVGWLPRPRKRFPWRIHDTEPKKPRPRHLTRLPLVPALLVVVLLAAGFVFGAALKLRPVDAAYFVITTATTTGYGDYSLKDTPDWLKLFGCVVMLTGGALFGILFSYLAALTTTERLGEVMGRKARGMEGHVVVTGLGNVGYRVTQYLSELGLDVVVVDQTPSARFADAVSVPVLTGDARLPPTLERASVARARALIACTNDDLANVQACLHAQRRHADIVTVARVSDDLLAERLTQAFRITDSLSATQSATGAFVGAAMNERALRPVQVGTLRLLACRLTAEAKITCDEIAAWRARGIRLLAFRSADAEPAAPSLQRDHLPAHSEAILCGPSAAILALFTDAQADRNSLPPSVSH